MAINYVVARSAEGWSVFEEGQAVITAASPREAIEMGQLLALAARAAGGKASLFVKRDDGALESCEGDWGPSPRFDITAPPALDNEAPFPCL